MRRPSWPVPEGRAQRAVGRRLDLPAEGPRHGTPGKRALGERPPASRGQLHSWALYRLHALHSALPLLPSMTDGEIHRAPLQLTLLNIGRRGPGTRLGDIARQQGTPSLCQAVCLAINVDLARGDAGSLPRGSRAGRGRPDCAGESGIFLGTMPSAFSVSSFPVSVPSVIMVT